MTTDTRPNNVRTALVTGASGGLGQAQLAALHAADLNVIAHSRAPSAEFSGFLDDNDAAVVYGDLSTPAQCRSLVRTAAAIQGRLDVVVANHAAMTMSPLVDADMQDWWKVIDVNLRSNFALLQESVRTMRELGTGGRIIVITSEWGVTGWPEATAYAASKSGLISLVKCLGRELAPEGIIVNAIAPGVIDTPQLAVDAGAAGISVDEMRQRYSAAIPMHRIGHPDEVAAAVTMLADSNLTSMVGQTIQINGGATRSRA